MEKTLNILLIEDDMIEIMKFNRVLNTMEIKHIIIEAHNGEDALALLNQKKAIPDIILLDLNMPKINGIEFLEILKSNPSLRHIPAIILTTSSNHKDVKECYKIGIAGYIIKPLKYEDYVLKIKKTIDYWCNNELI